MKLHTSFLATSVAGAFLMTGCVALVPLKKPAESAPLTKESRLVELQKAIDFNRSRVERDPNGAIGLAMLSEAYLAVARLSDDDSAAIQAEDAARRSLKARTVNNSRAANRLTEALLAQHRFVEARESAELAAKLSGNDPQSLRQLGDVLLELGAYDDFNLLVKTYPEVTKTPEGMAMMSRWYEVSGKPESSVLMLNTAIDLVKDSGKLDGEIFGWYQAQLGWTHLRNGDHESARVAFDSALKGNPLERKAIAGLARLAFESKDWEQVVVLSKRANAIAPLTDVMGWEIIALSELNRQSEATVLMAEIKRLNDIGADKGAGALHSHGESGAMHSHGHSDEAESRHTHGRLYSQFLADAGRDLEFAHHAAEEDLQWRKDIYAYDAFAWATYRFWLLDPVAQIEGDGLLTEAKVAIKKAMSLGTKDVLILAHAEEILAAQPRKKQ